MNNYLMPVDEKGINHSLASFLGRMLADGIVGMIMAPVDAGSGKSVIMSLMKSEGLNRINPFAPVTMVNSARLVSDLTAREAPDEKIGVLMRSCETRALIELAKHNQANLENIVIIGMDCMGTLEPADYSQLKESGEFTAGDWMAASTTGEYRGKNIRRACSACGHVEAEHSAIHLGWVGMDHSKNVLLSASEEYSDWASSFLEAAGQPAAEGRMKLLEEIASSRDENKKKLYEEMAGRAGSLEGLLKELSGCIRCYNCRQVCPLCFCRECVFSSDMFRHEPDYFQERAGRRGIMAMPADKLLFHLTRINHMALGCVGCGQCESACPGKIPLGIIFKMAGEKLQGIFDYVPGRSLEEETPLSTYREVELEPR